MNEPERSAKRQLPFLLRLNTVLPLSVLASLFFGPLDRAMAEDGVLAEAYSTEQTASHLEEVKADPLRVYPLFAVVSIADQHISVYGESGLLARSSVSTGMRGHSTPTGIFSIIQKQRWHESNIYSGAPMPLMQRITWSGIALHAGVVPGYPASHGCIRLPGNFASRLFGATEMGQRVVVAPSDTAPVAITHKTLPAPLLQPAPGGALSSAADVPATTASVDAPRQADGAVLEPVNLHETPAAAPEKLNPIEFARALKTEANGRARAAAQATREAMLLSARKTTELRMAARKSDVAEGAAADAARELAKAVRRLEDTDGKDAISEAVEARTEAEAALADAQKAGQERVAKATEAKTQAEAALADAQKARDEAVAKAAEAKSQAEAALAEARKTQDAALAEAAKAKTDAEAALTEAQKARDAGIAKATEAKTQADAALAEAEKGADDARKAETAKARSDAEAALTEAQKAGDAGVARAADARTQAEAALAEAQKAGRPRIAEAGKARDEAEDALNKAQKVADARVAKATGAKADAESDLAAAQKAADARIARATETKAHAEADLTDAQKAEDARIAKATEAKAKAEAALAEARKAAEEARAVKEAKEQELAAARKAAEEAKTASRAAAASLEEAARRLKPVSVFISRKTGRLYVRQNFKPLFDVPVSIGEPEREIGTHFYVSTSASEDGAALRWQAVSMPVADESEGRRKRKHRSKDEALAEPAPVPELGADTAQAALDRVTIPEDAARKLAELTWVGATVIISDNGISGETGPTTDFIILTRPKSSSR